MKSTQQDRDGTGKRGETFAQHFIKLLSSDYAWLDAVKSPSRRDLIVAGGGVAVPPLDLSEVEEPPLPEPPLAMQQTKFLANARLVLIKLRQQLEEVVVGAVRRMEDAILAPPMTRDAPTALASFPSYAGSGAPAVLATARSLGGASPGGASMGGISTGRVLGGGGGVAAEGSEAERLPPGFADEVAENGLTPKYGVSSVAGSLQVRAKLCAAFEDCLSDTMDQLWGSLQYAGSKHALVERMKQAMLQREAELEATASKQREEAAARLRALRRQKEEMEAAFEKERSNLKASLIAANQRVEFLDKDVTALRNSLEKERAQTEAKVDAQRSLWEVLLRAKEDALEALRSDSVVRIEELRQQNATLTEQLAARSEEADRLSARVEEQTDMLALAFARRDAATKEAEALREQLEDFRRFVVAPASLSLTDWLRTLKEGDVPLTPLFGGPLTMEYGTGRAFLAAARSQAMHAVAEEMRRVLPHELPWPEDGWPPDGLDGDGVYGMIDDDASPGAAPSSSRTSPTPGVDNSRSFLAARSLYPSTLPLTWLRFVRAPLGDIMSGPTLMAVLAELAHGKLMADRAARAQGLPPPDLHVLVYKQILTQHPSAADADEVVVSLVQSLRNHSKKLPRAATWMQLLQVVSPVLPPDACSYYVEAYHQLLATPGTGAHANVVDKASGNVWVSPIRWKQVLNGQLASVFDTERKAFMLKQAAACRVDMTRGSGTFGMVDGDQLLAALMNTWLSQRQAAMTELAAAWAETEPVGGGVLAVSMDVDQLAGIATMALGKGAVPQDWASRIELYLNTVQAARTAQAAARVRWSGLTTSSLGTALANAGLLPPRPLEEGRSPDGARLAVSAGHMLRIADYMAAEMRGQPGFRNHDTFLILEHVIERLRDTALPSEPTGGLAAEEERRVQAGWESLEQLAGALLSARDAYRIYDAATREQVTKVAVDMALSRYQRAGSDSGKAPTNSRPLSGSRLAAQRGRGSTRSVRMPLEEASGPSRLASGATNSLASRPLSGRAVLSRVASNIWPRDLRAALSLGHWSSDSDEEVIPLDDPPSHSSSPVRLQLRGRTSARQRNPSAGEPPDAASAAALAAEGDAQMTTPAADADAEGSAGGDEVRQRDSGGRRTRATAAASAAAAAVAEVDAERMRDDMKGAGVAAAEEADVVAEPDSPTSARLAQLESRYARLRSRFDETMRTLSVAYNAGNSGGSRSGPGLPSPEVMAQLGPAAKLRLVAELLAELHHEVEQGVWPQLDATVLAAVTGRGDLQGCDQAAGAGAPGAALSTTLVAGATRSGSRPASGISPLRVTVRPSSATTATPSTPPQPPLPAPTASPALGSRPTSAPAMKPLLETPLQPERPASLEPEESSIPPSAASQFGSLEDRRLRTPSPQPQPPMPEEPPPEVQEAAGRLHAHAGHVGQVMAEAALETAALAAALEDLASWRTPRRGAGVLLSSRSQWAALGGEVRSGASDHALGEEQDELDADDDPRDTAYLDALRALHLAAEATAQATAVDGPGAASLPANVVLAPLLEAVQQLVRLMGGQPRVTATGRIVEFFPRRVPKDWRHPLLSSSLARLYIYVTGALLQQHERAALLREAAADLDQRHTSLAKAAADLEVKAASLRGLQASLGVQLGAMAAWMSHGSVLMESLRQLDSASVALRLAIAPPPPLPADTMATAAAVAVAVAVTNAQTNAVNRVPRPAEGSASTGSGGTHAHEKPPRGPSSPERTPRGALSPERTPRGGAGSTPRGPGTGRVLPARELEKAHEAAADIAVALARMHAAADRMAVLAGSGLQAATMAEVP
ncbi:hypothetical protein GPECTOR_1g782 [Gonium pectorale]|uniref:Uncharacterized protein n=1 Tax=Gonium pectorale TaxID=33097 RepID=A0A150H3Z4_GONPE|nr:hypothetical protein GPECTOR_1g782 [Gonium pectorale]|eukprot:KXZ56867.1 hypothetical protein GPECTOR_1g782 [Gonium pectorale]